MGRRESPRGSRHFCLVENTESHKSRSAFIALIDAFGQIDHNLQLSSHLDCRVVGQIRTPGIESFTGILAGVEQRGSV